MDAVRQVGKSLSVKAEKVRIEPQQWEDVERMTARAPGEFKETLHLVRSGQYLGEANLTEAGGDVLRALDALSVAVPVQ